MKRVVRSLELGAKSEIPMNKTAKAQPKSTGGKKIVYVTEKMQPVKKVKM